MARDDGVDIQVRGEERVNEWRGTEINRGLKQDKNKNLPDKPATEVPRQAPSIQLPRVHSSQ